MERLTAPDKLLKGGPSVALGNAMHSTTSASANLSPVRSWDGYRLDVQALRGVAVFGVVLYHTGGLLPGGFAGVDVFFVISGFVIGRVLLTEYAATGSISLIGFFAKRSRRLLPALALMVAVVSAMSVWFAPFRAGLMAGRTAMAAMGMAANAYLYGVSDIGYFDPAMEMNPFLHTWSLSVEAQLYLVVPVLLIAVLAALQRSVSTINAVAILLGIIAVCSYALSITLSFGEDIGSIHGPRFAFYSPVTRAWEFALGFLVLLIPTAWQPRRSVRLGLWAVGIGALAWSGFFLHDRMPFPGWVAIVPALGTALLIWCGRSVSDDVSPRAPRLAIRALARVGDLSYSWYLWHWPFIVFATALAPSFPLGAVAAGGAALLPAWLSFRYLETPIRYNFSLRPAVLLCFAVLSVAVPFAVGFATQRHAPRPYQFEGVLSPFQMHVDWREGCDSRVPLGDRPPGTCTWGSWAPDADRIVLVGDSHAGHLSEAVIGAAEALGARVEVATLSACLFATVAADPSDVRRRHCSEFVRSTLEYLTANWPDVVVIGMTSGHWEGERNHDIITGLKVVVRTLEQKGVRVALLVPIIGPGGRGPQSCGIAAIAYWPELCAATFRLDTANVPAWVGMVEALEVVAKQTSARLLRYQDNLCDGHVCRVYSEGTWLWRDGGHISIAAAEYLIPALTKDLGALLAD